MIQLLYYANFDKTIKYSIQLFKLKALKRLIHIFKNELRGFSRGFPEALHYFGRWLLRFSI